MKKFIYVCNENITYLFVSCYGYIVQYKYEQIMNTI